MHVLSWRKLFKYSCLLHCMFSFAKRKKFLSPIGGLGFIIFLSALGMSLTETIWSVYLFQYTQSDVLVGLISSLFTAVSLLSFVLLIPFLEKNDSSRLYMWTLFLMGICYILFAVTRSLWVLVLIGIILSILGVIRIDTYGIIVSDNSRKKDLAKNEGIVYTTSNIGWLVGPLIASFFAERYGIPIIFLLSSFFFFLTLFSYRFLCIGSKKRIVKKVDGGFFRNIKDFFSHKELVKTYIISGAPSVWWSFVFVYVPLYIIQQGMGLQWVAYFLFAAILPVLSLEYYFNTLAEKIHYKRLFGTGNILLASLLLLSFFVQNVYFLLFLIVCGSIGIAMLEASSEAYFFLTAPKKRIEKYYSIYNTTLDVFGIAGKLFVAGIIAVLSFTYSFLLLAILFFAFAWIAFSMKEVSKQKS